MVLFLEKIENSDKFKYLPFKMFFLRPDTTRQTPTNPFTSILCTLQLDDKDK